MPSIQYNHPHSKKQKQNNSYFEPMALFFIKYFLKIKKRKSYSGLSKVKIWLHQNIQHIHKENKKEDEMQIQNFIF